MGGVCVCVCEGGGGGGGGGVDWGRGEGGCHVSMWKKFQISAKKGGWVLQMVQK